MAIGVTEIEWSDLYNKGGSVTVDSYGLSVGTECCGCASTLLTDTDDLIKLHKAIGDLIHARTGRRGVRH